jgi:hypothetical protein
MQKRVETECKTADQSRHQVQGSAAAQTRCHSGERLTEILRHRPRAHQREYHIKGGRPSAEEEEQAAAEVAAAEVAAAELAAVALPPRAFQPRVAAPAGTSARAGTSASSRLLAAPGWAVGMGSHPWSTSRN